MAENQRLSESDTIILSLHDRWWKKMLAGEKVLEIRKTRPAAAGPFRVLVYITGTGAIQGEFTCNSFLKMRTIPEPQERAGSCLTKQQLKEYAGDSGKPLWGWSVSGAKEYADHPAFIFDAGFERRGPGAAEKRDGSRGRTSAELPVYLYRQQIRTFRRYACRNTDCA